MSNRTVPAAAEGMSAITRRQALRTLAAGSAAGGLAAGAVVAVTPAEAVAADPCLAFMNGWAAALAECERVADPDSHWHRAAGPFEFAARDGRVPSATTAAGAAAALRKIIAADDSDPQDMNLIRAALAYLEGASA